MSTQLSFDEIKGIELAILKDVHEFCVSHEITYILIGGTLLGAIRHKGFIPWDDDVDIAMPRPDYERFISTYKRERYIAKSIETCDDYVFTFCKVIDTYTKLIENKTNQSNIGINIDIFPLDGLPSKIEEAEKHANKSLFYKKLITLKQMRFRKERSIKKNCILALSKVALLPFSYTYLTKLAIKHSKKYTYDESDITANLSWGFGVDEIMHRAGIADRFLMPFENTDFYVPRNYEEFLKNRYGDYMQLPPVEQRTTHHGFTAYFCDEKKE